MDSWGGFSFSDWGGGGGGGRSKRKGHHNMKKLNKFVKNLKILNKSGTSQIWGVVRAPWTPL